MLYSVAIDLGGTNIGAGVVDKNGELLTKVSVPVADSGNIEGLLHEVAEAARLAVSDIGMEISDMLFAGVGIPGVCRSEKGPVIFAPNIYWKEIDAAAALEKELLDKINALGIGPQGFGGKTTALAVLIESMPTHVAGLPGAVNISCHATRRKSASL